MGVILAPYWPNHGYRYYPVLLGMLADIRINLLQLLSARVRDHWLHKHLKILVCKMSGSSMQAKTFQLKQLTLVLLWRPDTKKRDASCIRKKQEVVAQMAQHPFATTIATAIDLLTYLHKQESSYSTICLARSASSCLLRVSDDASFSSFPIVKRLIKGFYDLNFFFALNRKGMQVEC